MKTYRIEFEQQINCRLDDCWEYFSNPVNLQKITPDDLKFKIISGAENRIYAGQLICYKIKLFGIFTLDWVTEITNVKDKEYFIDEQRFGPYKLWHHHHIFEQTQDGVLMKDVIHYGLYFGFVGRLANILFVRNKLKKIFDFRRTTIDSLWKKNFIADVHGNKN